VPDIECSLQDLLRPHLRKSGFQWYATFIGTDFRELELLQLPSRGYTYLLVVYNPGGGSVTIFFYQDGGEVQWRRYDGQSL
jgi:hypothetical protein